MSTDLDEAPVARRRLLHVSTASRPNADPRPNTLDRLADLAGRCGLDLGPGFAAAVEAAKELQRQAAIAARNRDVPPESATWEADRLRGLAGKRRAAALGAIDGERIEGEARRLVGEAVEAVTKAAVPPELADVAACAQAGGGKLVERFLRQQAADDLAAAAWELVYALRLAGVLPPTINGRRRGKPGVAWPESAVLSVPIEAGAGYVCEPCHRYGDPSRSGVHTKLSAAIARGSAPGVYSAEEAAATVAALLAAVEAEAAAREKTAAKAATSGPRGKRFVLLTP